MDKMGFVGTRVPGRSLSGSSARELIYEVLYNSQWKRLIEKFPNAIMKELD